MNMIRHTELVLQIEQQVQHLGPDRHVQRRHRLIRNHHARLQHQRPRDRDALPLAAGEHVRIPRRLVPAQPDARHHCQRRLPPLRCRHTGNRQRLLQDPSHRAARVQ